MPHADHLYTFQVFETFKTFSERERANRTSLKKGFSSLLKGQLFAVVLQRLGKRKEEKKGQQN